MPAARYVLSPRAQTDIDEIWDYSAAQWGREQAEFYIRQIKAAIEMVAANPTRGRSCNEIRAGYYKFPAGSHVLFYRVTKSHVDVVRILHRRMDFTQHF